MAHTRHIYTSHHYYYSSSSLYFFHCHWQAGWPRPFSSDTLTSWAGSAVAADYASVEAKRVPQVQGMQKPPHRVGEKRFLDHPLAVPELKVKKPAGLKTGPAWQQMDHLGKRWLAWLLRQGLVVCHGVADCQAWCPCTCKPSGG
jgi:hypothetical protein